MTLSFKLYVCCVLLVLSEGEIRKMIKELI